MYGLEILEETHIHVTMYNLIHAPPVQTFGTLDLMILEFMTFLQKLITF